MAETNEINNQEHDIILAARRVTLTGTTQQLVVEEDSNFVPLYVGTGAPGLSQSSTGWLIRKYSYTTDIANLSAQSAVGAWSNRAALTYT